MIICMKQCSWKSLSNHYRYSEKEIQLHDVVEIEKNNNQKTNNSSQFIKLLPQRYVKAPLYSLMILVVTIL